MLSTRSSSAVLRLYDFSCPPCYGRQVAGHSNYELVDLSGGLLRRVNQRRESWIFGSSFDRRHVPVNVLQGKGYTLKISNRKAPLKSVHLVRLQNPETFLKLLDETAFRSVRDAKIQPMFVVEAVNDSDPLPSGLELQLTIHKKNDFTLKHIILQQDMSTMEWCDITNMCTIGKGTCCDINIPVQKSARIWVIHLKRFICSLVPSLIDSLNDNMEVEVIDNNGNVQWSIDLDEILCLKEHVNALQAVDDEEKQIPWIAARVKIQNVEKVNCMFELKPFKPSEMDLDTANSDSLNCCTPL